VKGEAVTSWSWLLGTSVGSVLDAHGSNCPLDRGVKPPTKKSTVHASSLNAV